jgi:hypothetical protein
MRTNPVPFNRPNFGLSEIENIRQAIGSGVTSGNGPFCKKAESLLSSMHGGSAVLLTPSCSAALELAARLIGFEPGDEVIVPSYTFVTTVSSFVSNGATPVFCDIDPLTLGLDLEQARADNRVIRLLCEGCREGSSIHGKVAPAAIPLTDPLALIEGTASALTLNTDLAGKITIGIDDPQIRQTAYALLSDLLTIAKNLNC